MKIDICNHNVCLSAGHFVKLCKDLHYQQVMLEGDAIKVVNIMQKKTVDWSEEELLLNDALILCQSFDNWSINHVKDAIMR